MLFPWSDETFLAEGPMPTQSRQARQGEAGRPTVVPAVLDGEVPVWAVGEDGGAEPAGQCLVTCTRSADGAARFAGIRGKIAAWMYEREIYRQQGFAVFRGMLDGPTLAILNSEAKRLETSEIVAPSNIRTQHVRSLVNGSLLLEKFDPVLDLSKALADFSSGDTILEASRLLLATPSVTLFRDKLIYKHPGAPGYPLHQDYSWWHPVDPSSYCTLAVCLSDCTDDNGAIQFLCDTHHSHLLPQGERRALRPAEIAALEAKKSVSCQTRAGDIIAFHSLAVHWSGPNLSSASRPILYLGFIAGFRPELYGEHRRRQTSGLLADLRYGVHGREACFE